jgi:hypothetical protein
MSFDLCLIDLGSFNDLEGNLVRCQTSFHIYLGGINFISIVTFLRSWALVVSSLASKFLLNHHPFFVGDFGSHGLWHPLFPTTIEDNLGLLTPNGPWVYSFL